MGMSKLWIVSGKYDFCLVKYILLLKFYNVLYFIDNHISVSDNFNSVSDLHGWIPNSYCIRLESLLVLSTIVTLFYLQILAHVFPLFLIFVYEGNDWHKDCYHSVTQYWGPFEMRGIKSEMNKCVFGAPIWQSLVCLIAMTSVPFPHTALIISATHSQ